MAEGGIKLHIGGLEPKDGWRILNIQAGPHVDYVGNCTDLSFLADESCAEIYAAHVLEHLGYNGEIQAALKQIYRVLKPGGRLRVSVPDLKKLCELFVQPDIKVEEQWDLMRMMFGGRMDAYDIHLSGLTAEFLGYFLRETGFSECSRVDVFGEFKDMSSARFAGQLISLNSGSPEVEDFLFGRIFSGEPVSTSPENALGPLLEGPEQADYFVAVALGKSNKSRGNFLEMINAARRRHSRGRPEPCCPNCRGCSSRPRRCPRR